MKARTLPGAALLAALALAMGLAGCASRKVPPAPPLLLPEVSASISAGEASYLDQFSLSLPFTLSVANPGPGPVAAEIEETWLSLGGGAPALLRTGEAGTRVAAGSTGSLALALPVDLRKAEEAGKEGEGSLRAWAVEVVLGLRPEGGPYRRQRLAIQGSLALVREPSFSITYIVIEQDILVETAMRLVLEIGNPNAFPLTLSSFAYRLYGEGKTWASGTSPEALSIPALGSAKKEIGFTMNFADMDRRLFDLVAKQRLVNYRLAGEARIETEIPALPAFVTVFDQSGRSEVRK